MLIIYGTHQILTKIVSLSLFMNEESKAVRNTIICPRFLAGKCQSGDANPGSMAPSSCT